MLGGVVSGVTTGLLGSMGALVLRGTVPQARVTTHLWRPDGSMGMGIVNGRMGAAGAGGDGVSLARRRGRGPAPLSHTRGQGEVRVSSSTVAIAWSGRGLSLRGAGLAQGTG
jgi:hypothetical protein